MDYLDCKALSEVAELHRYTLAELLALRSNLVQAGVESTPLRQMFAAQLAGLIVAWARAEREYDRACAVYLSMPLASLWSGQAEHIIPTTQPVRAAS